MHKLLRLEKRLQDFKDKRDGKCYICKQRYVVCHHGYKEVVSKLEKDIKKINASAL